MQLSTVEAVVARAASGLAVGPLGVASDHDATGSERTSAASQRVAKTTSQPPPNRSGAGAARGAATAAAAAGALTLARARSLAAAGGGDGAEAAAAAVACAVLRGTAHVGHALRGQRVDAGHAMLLWVPVHCPQQPATEPQVHVT